MKTFLPFFIFLFITACSHQPAESDTDVVNNFLSDITSIENEKKNPIESFIKGANAEAAEVLNLNKNNIKDVLAEAKNYKHVVITVGNHTIVKITDIENCRTSGSWGACMPYAEGYIKRGELVAREDYINNIIGVPDEQERRLFLFE